MSSISRHPSFVVGTTLFVLAAGVSSIGCVGGADEAEANAGEAVAALGGVAHRWTFDEASGSVAYDSAGNVDGNLGSSVTRVPGVSGGAVSFDTRDDNAVVKFSGLSNLGTGDFTVSLWFKTTDPFFTFEPSGAFHSYSELLTNRNDGSHGSFFDLRLSPGGIGVELDQDTNGTNYVAVNVGGSFNNGQWHHVVVRRHGTAATLTIDGISATNHSAGVTDIQSAIPLALAGNPLSSFFGNHYLGQADELTIQGRALSDCELANMGGADANGNGVPDACESCVTIRRGLSGDVADSKVRGDQPNTNFGALPTFVSGDQFTNRYALVRYDLSPIPAGQVILSATAKLDEYSNLGASTIDVHRVTAAWSESTVTAGSFGSSFDPSPATSFANGGNGYTGPISFDLTALVSGWYGGAYANHGIALQAPTNSTWSSSEATSAAKRPALEVCYAPAP